MKQIKSHPIQVSGRTPEEIKSAEIKKAAEKKNPPKPKEKSYYSITLEALVPTTLTYRIYAFDEHDAIEQINKNHPTGIKPHINKKKDIKAVVYNFGSSMIKMIKNFRI
jgi:hypothetical protein